jgi:hypothetical protein
VVTAIHENDHDYHISRAEDLPHLPPWLREDRFRVGYVLIPHTGVSCIDYRFGLGRDATWDELDGALAAALGPGGPLAGLYELRTEDAGADACALAPANAVLTRPGLALKGRSLYLAGYFDNENSAARYWDLASWIAERVG